MLKYCFAFIFGLLVAIQDSGATKCEPLSSFKIDCNECICSSDGISYACTEKACFHPPSVFRQDDDAFRLPLFRNKRSSLEEDDLVFVNEPNLQDIEEDDIQLVDDNYGPEIAEWVHNVDDGVNEDDVDEENIRDIRQSEDLLAEDEDFNNVLLGDDDDADFDA